MIKSLAALVALSVSMAPIANAETAAGSIGNVTPRVTYVSRTSLPFMDDMTYGRVLLTGLFLGPIGETAVVINEGHKIAASSNIEDPGNAIGADIASAYARSHGYDIATLPISISERSASVNSLISAASSMFEPARYIVDGGSIGIHIVYLSWDVKHFQILYSTKVRVIDVTNGKIVIQSGCNGKSGRDGAPTHDQLLENGAVLLKSMIRDAASKCSAQIRAKTNLPAPNPNDIIVSPFPKPRSDNRRVSVRSGSSFRKTSAANGCGLRYITTC